MGTIGCQDSRIRKAELSGGLGALVLGMGPGLLFSVYLKPYAMPLLFIGILTHAWGMFDKHRLEKSTVAAPQPR